jgi:hypothetical protein
MLRMANLLAAKATSTLSQAIAGVAAAKLIGSSPYESPDIVGFDLVEANRLGVTAGVPVAITPTDTGRLKLFLEIPQDSFRYVGKTFPTFGTLVGLNKEEFVIETHGSAAVVRCHFPRLGYSIKNVEMQKSKL